MIEPLVLDRPPTSDDTLLLSGLPAKPADALLALIGAFRSDPRAEKIDVGVGVYRDLEGRTPVLRAVKEAERMLLAEQSSKGYLGPEGDIGFFRLLAPIALGTAGARGDLAGLQTPGGTGALRLAAELIATARPEARVLVGTPTWPNHRPILAAAGLRTVEHAFVDVATQTVRFDAMLDALRSAKAGDVVLLHGCCHNPTGVDLTLAQWAEVAGVVANRGLLPLIDLAYQGLGDGLEQDAAGMRLVLDAAPEALVAYSCDKNFGLYRERVGALFALLPDARSGSAVQSNLLSLARANWSMPPDHGAAIVRIILDTPALAAEWRAELTEMRERIASIRRLLADADPALAPLAGQKGMFSTLPLSADQVRALREDHAVYMAGSGRINVAGLTPANVDAFAAAVAAVR